MPKIKDRRRREKSKNASYEIKLDVPGTSTDDDSYNDSLSVTSGHSGGCLDETGNYSSELDIEEQIEQQEIFEEKLSSAIEGLNQKSSQGRTNSLESVISAFLKKVIPDYVSNNSLVLVESIERSMKKGVSLEQVAAARLASLLCLQLGLTEQTQEICAEMIPLLIALVNDYSVVPVARAKFCWALGFLTFISEYDNVESVMESLENVFNNRGKNSVEACVQTTAISAWSLLVTIHYSDRIAASADNYLSICEGLLDSSDLDVRMVTGETVAIILEKKRSEEQCENWSPNEVLLEKLQQLATDSQKFRSKKDRKTQRSTFRDILSYIEDNKFPVHQTKFGRERLLMDSWSRKKHYDTFCEALGSGITLHLARNDLLRDILCLGEQLPINNIGSSLSNKLERQLLNAAASKARTLCRSRNRDKRSANFHY